MNLLKQPNRWSCLPTALAMVLNVEIKSYLDHDGSEILYPELDEPKNRRAFGMQEMIDIAYTLGYALIGIDAIPMHGPDEDNIKPVYSEHATKARLLYYLSHKAVLTGLTDKGQRHAVAWNPENRKIYDPNGTIYELNRFCIETVWITVSINRLNGTKI